MRYARRSGCALGALAIVLSGALAGAQPATPEQQQSRALFEQARKIAEAGRWSEACPVFQSAHNLHSTGGTALQTANCYEKIGQLDRALPLYEYIVNHPDASKNPERLAIAEERVRAIKEQLERVEPPPPESTAPEPEPVTAPGSAPAPVTAPVTTPAPDNVGPSRAPAYIAFGVGAAGIAVGAVAGALALSQAADVKDRCEGSRCLVQDEVNKDAAMTKGWISTIGFGVGIAGAAVGVVLLLTGGKPDAGKVAADARGVTLRF